MSAESPSHTSPNPSKVISEVLFFKIPPFSAQKSHSAGAGGVPEFFLFGILIFFLLRSPCKITKPYDPSGRINNELEERRREREREKKCHL
jgi:hypothetical protein